MNHPSAAAIAQQFDQAAPGYDESASVQSQIARQLIHRATHTIRQPTSILDIGCGTGFVSEAATQQWPQAKITAIDHAPAMLQQARKKVPQLQTMAGDITQINFKSDFDLVLSSMMLHWLSDPCAELLRWRKWLKPNGLIHVALLTKGSFQEWRDLGAEVGVKDGLWPMPGTDFINNTNLKAENETVTAVYPSAKDFLWRLKKTGAATPRFGHQPLSAAVMRRLLAQAPKPFTASYHILYLQICSPRPDLSI